MARQYSDETKAAVMAALLTGQSISRVAEEYDIPEGTIKGWKSKQKNGGHPVALVVTQKKEEIGDLLIKYLGLSLETLQRQVKFFANETWLQQQSASEAAVLHGVIADKTIRLLEALADNSEEEPEL